MGNCRVKLGECENEGFGFYVTFSVVQKESNSNCLSSHGIHKFNRESARSFNLNFHSIEVVSRYRDPQLQVSEIKKAKEGGGASS